MRQVIRCKQCQDLIMAFRYIMLPKDRITEHVIDQMLGQGPWLKFDKMFCRKCGVRFTITDITQNEGPVGKNNILERQK